MMSQRARASNVPAGQRGFTIVEVLMAAALFLFITLSITALFSKSVVSNRSGADSSAITALTRTQAEDLFQADLDALRLEVPAGFDELVLRQYWDETTQTFTETAPADGVKAKYEREIRVRNCNIGDMADGTCDTPITSDMDQELISLKEIVITLESPIEALLGGRRLQLTSYKAF